MPSKVEMVTIGGIEWDSLDTATLATKDIPTVVDALRVDIKNFAIVIETHGQNLQVEALGRGTEALNAVAQDLESAAKFTGAAQALAGDSGR